MMNRRITKRRAEDLAAQDEAWREERDKALIALDVEWARRKLGLPVGEEFVLLLAMHKARYNVASIPEALRHESAQWLREHLVVGEVDGVPLLPPGQLPI